MAARGGNSGERTFEFSDPEFIAGAIAVVVALIWAAWYFGHAALSTVYVYFRYIELWPVWAGGQLTGLPGLTSINDWMGRICNPTGIFGGCQRDMATVQWDELSDSSMYVNAVILPVLIWKTVQMVRYLLKRHPAFRFTKAHNIKSFVEENMRLYPHLRMFAALDLIDQPLDHPLFGMSQTSRQFVFENGLIAGWQEENDGSLTPTLDRDKTLQLLHVQLGKLWTKSTDLSVPETMIAAIAFPKVAATDSAMSDAEYKAAVADTDRMLEWCWAQFVPPAEQKKAKGKAAKEPPSDPYAWLRPDIDLTEPRRIIQKYIAHPLVRDVINKHAFNSTVIFRAFLVTQRLGVLQPAEMRWMRFFCRPVWYLLENYGRNTGFAEASAVMGHYLYEIKQGSAIVEPQLDKVVNGIESAMTAFRYEAKDKAQYEAKHSPKQTQAPTVNVAAQPA